MRKGFAIIASLLVTAILLVLGMALLGKQGSRYAATRLAAETAQARALAHAGIEEVRVKLDHDLAFPPETLYSYTETIYDVDSTEPRGSYEVTVDSRWAGYPSYVVRVTADGRLPESRTHSTIQAEFKGGKLIRWEEAGDY